MRTVRRSPIEKLALVVTATDTMSPAFLLSASANVPDRGKVAAFAVNGRESVAREALVLEFRVVVEVAVDPRALGKVRAFARSFSMILSMVTNSTSNGLPTSTYYSSMVPPA